MKNQKKYNSPYEYELELEMDESLFKNTLAASVKRHRKQKGLSQQMLAEITGISPKFLSDVECGKCNAPSIITVIKLARALEKTVSELLEPQSTLTEKNTYLERINIVLNEKVREETHLRNIARVLEILFDNKENT